MTTCAYPGGPTDYSCALYKPFVSLNAIYWNLYRYYTTIYELFTGTAPSYWRYRFLAILGRDNTSGISTGTFATGEDYARFQEVGDT